MSPSERLVQLRSRYPKAMTPAQIGELLNRLAWTYRTEGMRLLGKASGNNCPMPNGTLISTDYVVHAPTQTGHDVLSGRDDGTTETVGFTWGPGPEDLRDQIASGARTIVAPVDPGAPDDAEDDEPIDDEDDPPAPTEPLTKLVKDLAVELAALKAHVKSLDEQRLQRIVWLEQGKNLPPYRGTGQGEAKVFGYRIPVTVTIESTPVVKEP